MTRASTGHTAEEDQGGLRTALAGLTTRGRSFLAAGVAAAICAYVLGQGDLLRVGLLLAVLPLVCATVLQRTRYRVSGSRRLSPGRVPMRLRGPRPSAHGQRLAAAHRPADAPGQGALRPRSAPPLRARPGRGGRPPRGVLPGALGPARPLPAGPAPAPADRPVRHVRADPLLLDVRHPDGHPARGGAAAGAADRRGEGVRGRAPALTGPGRRGRHHSARLPLRRRPAPRALAADRALRRADGPPRGAAPALPLHGAARHPGHRLPGRGPRLGLRVGRLGYGVDAGAHARTGLLGPPPDGHRHLGARRGRRRVRGRQPGIGGRRRDDDGHARRHRPLGRHGPVPGVRRAARRQRRTADRLPRRSRRGAGDRARQDAPAQRRSRRVSAGQRVLGAGTDRGARPVGRERGPAAHAARGGLDRRDGAAGGVARRPVAGGGPSAHARGVDGDYRGGGGV